MFREERLDQIVSVVNEQETILTEDLANRIGVSPATIRRDITELVSQGRIERVHGGVMACQKREGKEPSYIAKGKMNYAEKKRIAEYAAGLIDHGDSIILDSGSTCLEVARALKNKRDLAIVTNDLLVALEFATNENNNRVMMSGGVLRSDYYSTYGNFCEDMLRQIHTKKVLMGVDAIDMKRGLMSYTPDDIRVKQILLEMSNEVILVCDHTKFDVSAYIYIGSLTNVSQIITGKELSDEYYQKLLEMEIRVARV